MGLDSVRWDAVRIKEGKATTNTLECWAPFASPARASALRAALTGFAVLTARYGDAKGAGGVWGSST